MKLDFDRNGKGPEPSVSDGIAARGLVLSSRFVGKESIVELEIDKFALKLVVTIPGVFYHQKVLLYGPQCGEIAVLFSQKKSNVNCDRKKFHFGCPWPKMVIFYKTEHF